ncbi:glycosyl hydrolase [Aspergillus granulosus]|uniref:Glycosyl hydrolase n=1 Tax=Aspergillus granulosus TaxID=176169 RepID=A0ABR4HKU4_9EURO
MSIPETKANGANAPKFTRWRPTFHLIAPHSWLNDPCGPGYDPLTKTYHVAYQWNPKKNDWGDISWGHTTSTDLVSWEIDIEPCLVPSAPYDSKGIFTGCFQAMNLCGERDGTLMYFYTSVNKLPIHYTLPYSPGCETLSIALSKDAGRTWERYAQNPILGGPPPGLPVTGWRDPFVFEWPSAPERVRRLYRPGNEEADVLYGLISGGIQGLTPTAFLYAIDRKSPDKWTYLGDLVELVLNFTPSRWSGDFGINWEVANLVTLTDDEGVSRDFLILGTEGCTPSSSPLSERVYKNQPTPARDRRIQRSQLWMCIKENTRSASSSPMQYAYGGIFDNGLFYAANSFWDPATEHQIVFGWITEEDFPDDVREEQGWSGLISLPRVPYLQTIRRVKKARTTAKLSDISSIEAIPDGMGTYTVRTLGVMLDKRVERLRDAANERRIANVVLGSGSTSASEQTFIPLETTRWEVDTEIAVGRDCKEVGLIIYHDSDRKQKTVLLWDPLRETFQVNRPDLTNTPLGNCNINHAAEAVPHTLFTTVSPATQPKKWFFGLFSRDTEIETEEPLRIHALFDTSVLEIFVNGRTSLTTRIYQAGADDNSGGGGKPSCVGLQFYAEALESAAQGGVNDEFSTPPQPLSIRLLYTSSLLIQSLDTFAFYTISPLLFPNRSDFAHPATRFFLRQNATLLLPFILNCWFLRDYHIRHTRIGRVVGSCFALFHGSALAMYSWSRWADGEYNVEPFGLIAGLHGVWAFWAVWGLVRT